MSNKYAPIPIASWFHLVSAASATRHDCKFVGGPCDEQIHEVSDNLAEIGMPCLAWNYVPGKLAEPATYGRTSPTTFAFRSLEPPAEPKVETWRDRAIREPMF